MTSARRVARQLVLASLLVSLAGTAFSDKPPTTTEVMAALEDSDWRRPDPANLLYMQLPQGRVIMELAPGFAPLNVANINMLTREGLLDNLAIIRSQDNYVVQWGDPDEDELAVAVGLVAESVSGEFQRSADGVDISVVESRDVYADTVGFADGFPVASDGDNVWLTHCYGMVGVARGIETDSGNGTSLYVITGHAPRHLDRNITLAGRVISGIEYLTTLPRGTGNLGFYVTAEELTPIASFQMGDEIAEEDRASIEIMRTDSAAFIDYVKSRTYRHEEWFVEPTGRIDICIINPPIRVN